MELRGSERNFITFVLFIVFYFVKQLRHSLQLIDAFTVSLFLKVKKDRPLCSYLYILAVLKLHSLDQYIQQFVFFLIPIGNENHKVSNFFYSHDNFKPLFNITLNYKGSIFCNHKRLNPGLKIQYFIWGFNISVVERLFSILIMILLWFSSLKDNLRQLCVKIEK